MVNIIQRNIGGVAYRFASVSPSPKLQPLNTGDFEMVGAIKPMQREQIWHVSSVWGMQSRNHPLHERIQGIKILGAADPRLMSSDEFHASPGLLYHGSSNALSRYDPNFDYRSFSQNDDVEGSATCGVGYYTTSSLSEAEKYSRFRQNHSEVSNPDLPAHVLCLRPYQACLLDLRSADDINVNGAFPRELALRWLECCKEDLKNRAGDCFDHEYLDYLDALLNTGLEVNLRELLNTVYYPYPTGWDLFSHFMMQEGFDGIIFNEKGDSAEFEMDVPSYVFYNPKVLGTFASWQGRED